MQLLDSRSLTGRVPSRLRGVGGPQHWVAAESDAFALRRCRLLLGAHPLCRTERLWNANFVHDRGPPRIALPGAPNPVSYNGILKY